ncbi:MAG: VWA domain-containing protein [Acaryochloridaceae cyanobacterium SU_2_1]|nr:VWA domain-containing protein [Acaryochloridaceae cyanobacterium SU_2_1]
MHVDLRMEFNDQGLEATAAIQQRQLAIAASVASTDRSMAGAPLNLCLILDQSGSMSGRPLATVKEAAQSIVDRLQPHDRLSVVAFDHRAQILVPSQAVTDPEAIKATIQRLEPKGGTAIDEGLKLGIQELALGRQGAISQAFLLTDGENEHGDNQRCQKFAQLAARYNITLNALGFGSHWNEDVLEGIADAGGGSLTLIETPDHALTVFNHLFTRIASVSLTNAHLLLSLSPGVRLAALKPIAQVQPETVELSLTQEGTLTVVRLGDLMPQPRTILVNLYIDPLPLGQHTIAKVQLRYDYPALAQKALLSETLPAALQVTNTYQPQSSPEVQHHILALAKYRQTQLAELKLQDGDRGAAASMFTLAAKTALQMGDQSAATVLQSSATCLQSGQVLSEGDRKKTRIASKTTLQSPTNLT